MSPEIKVFWRIRAVGTALFLTFARKIFTIMAQQEDVFKKIISHCKEYGFVFPSSDIYDGLGAVYDYGQNGVELKNNIKQYWWRKKER